MKTEPVINITPLIDVLLVLLIIFMVISPMKPHRFAAQIPHPASTRVQYLASIIVSIAADGGLSLNRREMSAEELMGELSKLMRERASGDRAILISGAPSLAYHQIVEVIDLAKSAGAEEQGLLLDQAQ